MEMEQFSATCMCYSVWRRSSITTDPFEEIMGGLMKTIEHNS